MALHEFLDQHRADILERTLARIAETSPNASETELSQSLPELLDEVVAVLRAKAGLPRETSVTVPEKSATAHGQQRLQLGFTMTELVEDYGALCYAITSAAEHTTGIEPREYQILNRVLDEAIADAVSEYAAQRELERGRASDRHSVERLGFVAHELRNALSSALLSFQAIKSGQVAIGGRTSEIHERSLRRMQALIDRSLAEVRMQAGADLVLEPTRLRDLLEDVEISTAPDAQSRHSNVIIEGDCGGQVRVDRALVISALANLVQNAIKYSPAGSEIRVRCTPRPPVTIIEVEDRCGGLAPETDALFESFVRGRRADRGGLGLGLVITRRAIEAHGGTIGVRNRPGTGCVMVVELPG